MGITKPEGSPKGNVLFGAKNTKEHEHITWEVRYLSMARKTLVASFYSEDSAKRFVKRLESDGIPCECDRNPE